MVQHTQNAFHHPGEIGIDIRIPESKNPEALRLQKGVARLIRSSAFEHSMLTAVGFDDEFRPKRNKVDDVGTDGRLPAEMKALKTTDRPPQQLLGMCRLATHPARRTFGAFTGVDSSRRSC